MSKSLIIWVPAQAGFETLKFENVSNLEESKGYITFEYDGVSTGEHRKAVFQHKAIIGASITWEDAEDSDE